MADAIRLTKITARVAAAPNSPLRVTKTTARVALREYKPVRITRITARVAVVPPSISGYLGAFTPGVATVM